MQLGTARNSETRDGIIGDRQAEQPENYAARCRFENAAKPEYLPGHMATAPHPGLTGLEYDLATLKYAVRTHMDT